MCRSRPSWHSTNATSRVLYGIPHGAAIPPQDRRKPAGLCVGEVSERDIKRWPYYSAGDYIGIGGVESAYEVELRGRKGVKVETTDTHGAVKGSLHGRCVRHASGQRAQAHIDDRCPPASLRRGAYGGQDRGCGSYRAVVGRDTRHGFVAYIRSRRAGRPPARQPLHDLAGERAAAAVQPCRQVEVSAGIDIQAGTGAYRHAGGGAAFERPAPVPRGLRGGQAQGQVPLAPLAGGSARRRGHIVQRILLLRIQGI